MYGQSGANATSYIVSFLIPVSISLSSTNNLLATTYSITERMLLAAATFFESPISSFIELMIYRPPYAVPSVGIVAISKSGSKADYYHFAAAFLMWLCRVTELVMNCRFCGLAYVFTMSEQNACSIKTISSHPVVGGYSRCGTRRRRSCWRHQAQSSASEGGAANLDRELTIAPPSTCFTKHRSCISGKLRRNRSQTYARIFLDNPSFSIRL